MSDLYNELLELAIYEDTIKEYKNRRSLQEGVLGAIAAIILGPYAVAAMIGGICYLVMKVQGKKKDKIFKILNSNSDFKKTLNKLISEVQSDIKKNCKYSKYLKTNTIENLNDSNADIVKDYTCLCLNNILEIDMKQIWKDNSKISAQELLDRYDNPDDYPEPPKEVINVFNSIKESVQKIEKGKDYSLDISKDNYTLPYSVYYDFLFDSGKVGINFYIKIKEIKEK